MRPCAGWFAEVLRILARVLNGQEERLLVGGEEWAGKLGLYRTGGELKRDSLIRPACWNYKQSVVHKGFVNTFVLAAAGDVRYDPQIAVRVERQVVRRAEAGLASAGRKDFKVELHGGQIVAGFKMRVIWP